MKAWRANFCLASLCFNGSARQLFFLIFLLFFPLKPRVRTQLFRPTVVFLIQGLVLIAMVTGLNTLVTLVSDLKAPLP